MATKVIPTRKAVTSSIGNGIKYGGGGGLAVGVGALALGPVFGPILGGTIAGAMSKGVYGDIIVINAIMDAVALMFIGGAAGGNGGSI